MPSTEQTENVDSVRNTATRELSCVCVQSLQEDFVTTRGKVICLQNAVILLLSLSDSSGNGVLGFILFFI